MLFERLLSHPDVEHQPEDVQMDMLVRQSAADHVVSGDFQDLIMELRIGAGKARVACVTIDRRLAVAHVGGGILELLERLRSHIGGGKPGSFGFDQQAKGIEVFELLTRPLRGCTIADQVLFANEALAFQPAQGLADRRLRNAEFASEDIDRNACTRRNIERHQPVIDAVVDAFDHTRRANTSPPACPLRCNCHYHSPTAY